MLMFMRESEGSLRGIEPTCTSKRKQTTAPTLEGYVAPLKSALAGASRHGGESCRIGGILHDKQPSHPRAVGEVLWLVDLFIDIVFMWMVMHETNGSLQGIEPTCTSECKQTAAPTLGGLCCTIGFRSCLSKATRWTNLWDQWHPTWQQASHPRGSWQVTAAGRTLHQHCVHVDVHA